MMQLLAQQFIRRFKPTLILVTGMSMRNGAQEALYTMLNTHKYTTKRNPYHFSYDALMYTILDRTSRYERPPFIQKITTVFVSIVRLILGSKKYPKYVILSVPLNKTSILKKLAENFSCDIVVITDTEALDPTALRKNIKESVHAVRKMLRHPGGLIVRGDDSELSQFKSPDFPGVTFGESANEDIWLDDISIQMSPSASRMFSRVNGVMAKFMYGGNAIPMKLDRALGKTQMLSLLAAFAVAIKIGINPATMVGSLSSYRAPKGIFSLVDGIKHTLIIDHSYGMTPASVEEALEILQNIESVVEGDTFLVVGALDGLGVETESVNRALGEKIAAMDIDYLVTVGEKARDINLGAKKAGMDEFHMFSFTNHAEAGSFVQKRMEEGDVVCVLGSPKDRLEHLVKEIMTHPQDAHVLLARGRQFKEDEFFGLFG